MRYPNRKMMKVLLNIFHNTSVSLSALHFFIVKLMALPTAKRKEGKTRSVGVNPFQFACNKGEKVVAELPGVFTMIIRQTVNPRKTSRARNRFVVVVILVSWGFKVIIFLIRSNREP